MRPAPHAIDAVTRRSASVSLVFHGVVCLLALAPAVVLVPADPARPPAAIEPAPMPRLVLAPLPKPTATPALPALAPSALPGFREPGSAPLPADITVPRNTDHPAVDRDRGKDGTAVAEVELPRLANDPATLAGRLNGKRWTNQELTSEQKRLTDATSLLEFFMRKEFRREWFRLRTPSTRPKLLLRLVVDAHGRVVEAQRGNATGSTALDEVIDRWLHQQVDPVSLPAISPGVPHFMAVTLYDSR